MDELDKMYKGLWYDANHDPYLSTRREEADELLFELNHTAPKDKEKRNTIIQKLMPHKDENAYILPPFFTDYGINCFIGENTFINRNAYLMDGGKITIGKHCFIGPNCSMYTANHPFLPDERNTGLEKALPITLGDNVWIGGDVTILPGVTIGDNAVIGAKSLVTKDIPANSIAVGAPCRVIRKISSDDTIANDLS